MNRWHIDCAARVLRAGGVIAYPTEAVWGLGCDPFNPIAVARLLGVKKRPVEKGLILISGQMEHFFDLLENLSEAEYNRIEQSWPGFHTWVVPHKGRVPYWISGESQGVALRQSTHPQVAALTRAFAAPIVSTSANIAGREVAKNPLQLRGVFGGNIDYLLPGQLGNKSSPSPIRDIRNDRVFRVG